MDLRVLGERLVIVLLFDSMKSNLTLSDSASNLGSRGLSLVNTKARSRQTPWITHCAEYYFLGKF